MFEIRPLNEDSRDTNHRNVSKRKPKRPREPEVFEEDDEEAKLKYYCNIDADKTDKFIARCKKGEITGNHRVFNKEAYVQSYKRPKTLQWILDDPCTINEVEYWEENGPTGKVTGEQISFD